MKRQQFEAELAALEHECNRRLVALEQAVVDVQRDRLAAVIEAESAAFIEPFYAPGGPNMGDRRAKGNFTDCHRKPQIMRKGAGKFGCLIRAVIDEKNDV